MRNIYLIDDGDKHWYSEESEKEAVKHWAEDAGYDDVNSAKEDLGLQTITQEPDDKILRVRMVDDESNEYEEKTCREWADEKSGLIATTVW